MTNDRVSKIQALATVGSTEGERRAARSALSRVTRESPLWITATVINIDRGDTFYEVRFSDVEGGCSNVRLPRELFHKPDLITAELTRLGAALSDDRKAAREQVQAALAAKSEDIRKITSRPGWHSEDCLVYPGRTFGAAHKRLSYEPTNEDDDALGLTAGSLDKWREGLRKPCEASDYLILAISHKAASTLLEVIGQQEGMLLHLHGANTTRSGEDKARSSSGKTLATRVAASMTGRCRKNDLLTFAITERAVEDHCYGHNSLGIEFDEEGRAFSGKRTTKVGVSQLGYTVASGRGGVRSTKATRDMNLKNRKWVLNAISSGELPLDDPSVRSARAEEEQVRMIGLPVPRGSRGGIFNRADNGQAKVATCAALARETEITIAQNYGVAFLAFWEKLFSSRDGLAIRIPVMIDEFVRNVGADGSPWERRFAEKFGLAYSAAVLLSEFGVAPWSIKRAKSATRRMYNRARRAAATVDDAAARLIDRLRRRITEKKYPRIEKGKQISSKTRRRARNGFLWNVDGLGYVFLAPIEKVAKLAGPPAILTPVLRLLAKRNVVHLGPQNKTTRQFLVKALSSRKHRYVCFDVEMLVETTSAGTSE